jgi:hypothetical protein
MGKKRRMLDADTDASVGNKGERTVAPLKPYNCATKDHPHTDVSPSRFSSTSCNAGGPLGMGLWAHKRSTRRTCAVVHVREREQILSTEELEIEHLKAKDKDKESCIDRWKPTLRFHATKYWSSIFKVQNVS